MEFPRWMYRQDLIKGRLFYTPKELAEAGDGWYDSPAFLHKPDDDATGSTQEPAPVKRGPGRPRKVAECEPTQPLT